MNFFAPGSFCKNSIFSLSVNSDCEIGDRRGEAGDLGYLGDVHQAQGNYREAISFYEKQLVITRQIGDRRGEGSALDSLANAYFELLNMSKPLCSIN
jgi:tetratricopeptide (TPR) repeat protein